MNLNSYIDTFISSDEKYDRLKFFNRNDYDFFKERDKIEILEIERKYREWKDKLTYSNWSWEEFKKDSGSGKVYRDFHPSVLKAFEDSHKDILTKKYRYDVWKNHIKSFLSSVEDDNDENEEKKMTINEYIETLPENDRFYNNRFYFRTWLARHTGYDLDKERNAIDLKDIQKSFDEWLNKIRDGYWSWKDFKNEAWIGNDYKLFDISVLDNFEKDKKNFDIIYTDEGKSLRYKSFKYWTDAVNSSLLKNYADTVVDSSLSIQPTEENTTDEEEKETPTKLLLPAIPKKVAKSIASVMAFFDWAKVVDYEKQEGRFQGVDEIDALDKIKTTALNEMFGMVDDLSLKNEDYQWREAAHCLRYEYYKDSGFKLMYCPESTDWIFDDNEDC
jgi:hypothetical protein